MAKVVLVIGVQGSGKSWVCRQLKDRYRYIPHDRCWRHPDASPGEGDDVAWGPKGSKSTHWETLVTAARRGGKDIITEAPFGESALISRLEAAGVSVEPVFVTESEGTISARYQAREGRMPPPGVLTRAAGLRAKARERDAFAGTSEQVLAHLKGLKA